MTESLNGDTITLYCMMIVMLLAGAWNTIFLKLQIEWRDNNGDKFKHPYFGSINTFSASWLGNLWYFVYLMFQKNRFGTVSQSPNIKRAIKEGKKTKINPLFLALPGVCDFIALPLMNLGLILIDASVYQMIRGGLVFITAMMSIMFLKTKLHRHHWIALVCIVGGVIIVGINSVLKAGGSDNIVIGIILLILSQFFSAAHWIIEEKFLQYYYIHPFKMVGLEGVWNVIFSFIMVTILQFIPCSGSYWSNGKVEDSIYN